MHPLLTLLASLLLAAPLSLAYDENLPPAGKDTFDAFKKNLLEYVLHVGALRQLYVQPQFGVQISYPSDWIQMSETKTSTKLDVAFFPQKDNKMEDGSVNLRVMKRSVPQTFANLDKFFDERAYMDGGAATIGDWYIPSMSNLEKTDITINGRPGRQYLYTSYRNGKHYVGVSRLFFIDKTLYNVSMFSGAAPERAYAIFDAMAKSVAVGEAKSASSARVRVPAASTRFTVRSSSSASSVSSCASRRRGACSSSSFSSSSRRPRARLTRPPMASSASSVSSSRR